MATKIDLTGCPTSRPTTYEHIDYIVGSMRAAGRDELVHYAGACHRDAFAWAIVQAWYREPDASERVLYARAMMAVHGVDVSPAQAVRP